MAKIGRNESCPCGSGEKYKKCCLAKSAAESEKVVIDAVTLHIVNLLEDSSEGIADRVRLAEDELYEGRTKLLKMVESSSHHPQKHIEDYVRWVEEQVSTELKLHSPFFWLSLERRPPPHLMLDSFKTLPQHNIYLLMDLGSLITALIMKHGDWEKKDWEQTPDLTLLISPGRNDVIKLWGYIYPYTRELFNLTGLYRRAGKNSALAIGKDKRLMTNETDDLRILMELYQNRRFEHGATLGPPGTPGGMTGRVANNVKEIRETEDSIVFFAINEDPAWEVPIPEGPGKIIGPAYHPVLFDLGSVIELLTPFSPGVERATGLQLDELRLCFNALRRYIADFYVGRGAYTLLSRGVLFAQSDYFFQSLCRQLSSTGNEKSALSDYEDIVQRFVTFLKCTPETTQAYDVLVRQGNKCLFQQGSESFLDLTQMPLVLLALIWDLQIDDEMRRIKGSNFERDVASNLADRVPERRQPIRPGLALRRVGEQDPFAEFDVYVESGSILFLIECKAYSLTRGYMQGEKNAVERRWEKVQEWVQRSDDRAREVAKHRVGSNYLIREGITHIVPIVCTPFAEFIWTGDPKFFLVERKIPRVCTYSELEEFLREEVTKTVLTSPYAFPIA